MTSLEARESQIISRESSYLFHDPESFVNEEMREWLNRASIAHISSLWLPLQRDARTYGGIEDVVLNNVSALSAFGAKEQLIYGHPNNTVLEERIRGTKVFPARDIDTNQDLLKILRDEGLKAQNLERLYLLQAYESIRENMNDISIIHDHTNIGRDHAFWVSEFLPVVRTEHGPLIEPWNDPEMELFIRNFENKKDMGFIAISQNQRDQMPNLNWLDVVYNGVDLNDFDYQEEKDDYLLFLGRVCRQKGTHNAARVASQLGRRLIIAGGVEETEESEKYYKEEVEPLIDNINIVHLNKGVNTEERKYLMSHTQALLMLNEWDEPFGMVMVEAMASGTPVVGFNKGSIPEIVRGKTGFVVENLEEAKEAVIRITKGDYSSEECRRVVEQYFTKEAMAAKYTQVYMKAQETFNRQPRTWHLSN